MRGNLPEAAQTAPSYGGMPVVSRLSLLLVAIILGAASLFAAVIRFTEPLPISPWEPAIAMEAVRLNAGLPLYEMGHATHMYGPLLTASLAGIFRITGLNLLAGRIAMSVFSIALAALLSAILCRERLRRYGIVAFLLFLGINFRTNLIFFSAQADCAAALFAISALAVWVWRENSWLGATLSIALFLCAMLLKQTSAAFALIPVVYALIWKRRFSEVVTSLIPAISLVAALGTMYLVWPAAFSAMVTVPAAIKVNYDHALPLTVYFIATFPIFLVALMVDYFERKQSDERQKWIWSGIAVLVPVSIWTICKNGGGYSSLLFGYLAMTSLFVIRLDAIWTWITSLRNAMGFLAVSVVVIAILFSFLLQFERVLALLSICHGDNKYDVAISVAQKLGDGVVSPQDPILAYRANRYVGRSLFFELDAHAVNGNWPDRLPNSVLQELRAAKSVIALRSYVPTPMFESGLRAENFHPVAVAALDGSAYTLWTK